MTAPTLLLVTQVAPYLDGPAGVHGVLDQAAVGVAEVAELHGLRARRVHDVRTLGVGAIADAAALALFTIGETPWSTDQRTAVVGRVRSGDLALVAIHSATDSCHAWDEYGWLVGARFDGHPWTREVDLEVVESAHPATVISVRAGGGTTRCTSSATSGPTHAFLLRAPEAALDLDAPGAKRPEFGFPLSWCFAEGSGRVFSTSLGHFPHAWESPAYLRHLAGGLAWALGEGE